MQHNRFKSFWFYCRRLVRGGRWTAAARRAGWVAFEPLEDRCVLNATIEITDVPTYGVAGFMEGVVTGVDPAAHRVAPYIYIDGGAWWTKPTSAMRTVPINPDGTFTADVATGGIDERAVIYCAALVPNGYEPPLAAPSVSIPDSLEYLAIDFEQRFGRTVEFAGYTWGVKESPSGVPVGPGGGPFSYDPADVFVDGEGLHLSVHSRDGAWWSTEVTLDEPLGYGTYCFQTNSELDDLDVNVTFGAFTWDPYGDERSGASANREIDFEDARWGTPGDPTSAQMVVQPYTVSGNLRRYTLPDLAGDPALTRWFTWEPGRIKFTAVRGHHEPCHDYAPGDLIDEWVYEHDPAVGHYVPTEGRAQFKFNLWLIDGESAPAGAAPVDVVITDFNYQPLPDDEIGVHRGIGGAGYFIQDYNGNGYWDGGDRYFVFGQADDTPIIGDWNGDGYDEIGVHRNIGGAGYFIQDYNGSGAWDGGDRFFAFGDGGDKPVIGDWDGNGHDEIGTFRNIGGVGYFIQDYNGNGYWDGGDRYFVFGDGTDTPIIGDWNGDGYDEIGTHRGIDGVGYFIQDYNGSGAWNVGDRYLVFGDGGDTPIIGDWSAGGYDQVGTHRDIGGAGYFIQDFTGNGSWDVADRYFAYGGGSDAAIIGNWTMGSPLMAATEPAPLSADVGELTTDDLAPIVAAAIDNWSSAVPLTAEQSQTLRDVDVQIADLPGGRLGRASGNTITLDVNAAGYGWFVDDTPWDSSEFEPIDGTRDLTASAGSPAANRFDLVTAVTHELGHLLGFADDYSDIASDSLMNGWLGVGGRRSLTAGEHDRLFADADWPGDP